MANKTKAQKEAEAAAAAAQANTTNPDAQVTEGNAPANKDPAPEKQGNALADGGKKAAEKATCGRIVHFYAEQNSGNSVVLKPWPAIVIQEAAKESNLPENSVDLGVHTRAGYETRFGVMFSEEPKAGRWSWPKR